MKKVTFIGKVSGDMECFCWDDVPLEDVKEILGEEEFNDDLERHKESAEDDDMGYMGYKKAYNDETGEWEDLTEEEVEKNIEKKMQRIYPGTVIASCLGIKLWNIPEDKKYRFTLVVEEIE
jgi:hypothetical protein